MDVDDNEPADDATSELPESPTVPSSRKSLKRKLKRIMFDEDDNVCLDFSDI
jgi:hypothetical protein